MKLLTYINGILTVKRDNLEYQKETTKPSFMLGSSLYYEPTLKQMDTKVLDATLVSTIEAYIDAFDFSSDVTETITDDIEKLYVNSLGEFIGNNISKLANVVEVSVAPNELLNYPIYIDGEFVESCLVSKITNKFVGVGNVLMIADTEYAPYPTNTEPFSISQYSYDKDTATWSITLHDAKNCKISGLKAKQQAEVTEFLGTLAFGEMSSFLKQADEALAWEKDNSLATPFIDKILISRNLGEDRETFLALVLYKSKLFEDFYATNLGKFQGLMKLVDRVVSIDEVKSIVW